MEDDYILKTAIYIFVSDRFYDLIYSCFGMRFIIHPKENGHNKPHIHIKYQDFEIVMNIINGETLAGNIPNSKYKIAKEWVVNNKEYLLMKLDDLVKGVKV